MDINKIYGDTKKTEKLLKSLEDSHKRIYGLFADSLAELSEQILKPNSFKKELINIDTKTNYKNYFTDNTGHNYRYFYYLNTEYDDLDDDDPDIFEDCLCKYNIFYIAIKDMLKYNRVYGRFGNSVAEAKEQEQSLRLEDCIEDKSDKMFIASNGEKYKFFYPIKKEKKIYIFDKSKVHTLLDTDLLIDNKSQGFLANSILMLREYVETNNKEHFGNIRISKIKFDELPYFLDNAGFMYFYPIDEGENE